MRYLFLLLVLMANVAVAQLQLPEWSSDAMIRQKIGYTTFEMRYGRPSVRGRKIFDGLVPFNRLWRTGAGKASTIYFDKDVTIAGKKIGAGIYSLATIPGEKEWSVMLNSDTSKIYGAPSEYDSKTEVLRFTVSSKRTARFYETLTIDLEQKKNDAVFVLLWENTEISFPIETGTNALAIASINSEMQKNPADHELKLTAAWYYYMNNEDPSRALGWVNESLAKEQTWWGHELKVDLLERLNKKEEARKAAQDGIAFLKEKRTEGWERGVAEFELKLKNLGTTKAR